MERLRHDDPSHVGPYVILARLDSESTERTVAERRYLGRTADGERTVLVCVPRVGADPSRWAIEAEGARRLSVPRFLRIAEVGGTAGFPWYAAPYTPALPLPAVLAAYGGPLPEDTVRRLGAALAEGLTAAHAQGVAHAGLSPAAVLVTAGGPLLTCFGAVRAAAPDGTHRTGLPGLDPGCLAVEQASGGRPRPLGDVFALGAVLAYASTGHTVPEQSELPPGLRTLVGSCLSSDPAVRPQSAQDVLGELVSPGAGPAPSEGPCAQAGTVLDHGAVPLPSRIVAALAAQSAALLAAELPTPQQPFATAQKVH
ncbi:serine/threonine protein kinase [Streptomyces sp. NRRL F-2580]|uniref:serine/threonine protein kinase n=1 Tax=Streptomyces sp. NRRL F-2580 TaxID=1463841 RepID=UPI0004CB94B5|nr:serine/threonine protein kinase [Streptomyces sp. NRRL F-2580]